MTIRLKKITATDAVVESLKQRIRGGEFNPGEKLPSEQLLLKQYDVSRLTLREALARLAAWGIIQVRHGKGAFISRNVSSAALDNVLIPMFVHTDPDRMNELVETRNMIEAEVAARVAEKRTRQDILRLEKLLAYDESGITDAERFAGRDYEFHLALARMAGNGFMLAIYQALHSQIQSFLIEYANSIDDWEEALERHRPILEAIIARDRDKAAALAREHARVCASYIDRKRRVARQAGQEACLEP